MAIEKVYSLNITKGRCKDTEEWEIYDVKAKHVGYSPIENLTETTNPFEITSSGVTYECDKYENGVYVYNSKYVNGTSTEPKLFTDSKNDLNIPTEIVEKYRATSNNTNIPFVKKICKAFWSNECPYILTDYGVFMSCDTASTLFNYISFKR